MDQLTQIIELYSILPALIGAAGALAGGLFADKGTREANTQNLKIAREQMQFQERMSSTAYQRATKDLSAAGLNRILAIGSPASSPSGALATMQSETAGKADALKTGTSSALQARIANQQFKQAKAQTTGINTQTLNTAQGTLKLEAETRLASAAAAKAEATESVFQKYPWLRILQEFLPVGAAAGAGVIGGAALTNKAKSKIKTHKEGKDARQKIDRRGGGEIKY